VTGGAPGYRPRRPSGAPTEGSLAERDAFTALARQSLAEVRASAEALRNGVTAFLTLVTTGVIIKGRDTTAGLSVSWRVVVTVLIGGGLALGVAGLWRILAAQAGTRYRLSNREDIRRGYGSVDAYRVALADRATEDLDTGRRLGVGALALLLLGVGASWWAPTTEPAPGYVTVTSGSGATACGILRSANDQRIQLLVPGRTEPLSVPDTPSTTLTAVDGCG